MISIFLARLCQQVKENKEINLKLRKASPDFIYLTQSEKTPSCPTPKYPLLPLNYIAVFGSESASDSSKSGKRYQSIPDK